MSILAKAFAKAEQKQQECPTNHSGKQTKRNVGGYEYRTHCTCCGKILDFKFKKK